MPTGCSMLVLAALLTTTPSNPGDPAHAGAPGCGDVADPAAREERWGQAVRRLAAAVAGSPDPGSCRLGAARADAGFRAPPSWRPSAVELSAPAAESDDPRVPPGGELPGTEAGRADDLDQGCAVSSSAEPPSVTDGPRPTQSRRERGEATTPGCPSVDASCSRPARRPSPDQVSLRRTDPRSGSSVRSVVPPTAGSDPGAGVEPRGRTAAPFSSTTRTTRDGLPASAVLDAHTPGHSGGPR